MRNGLLAILLLSALALSGCSGGKGDHDVEDVTCPDGTILASDQIEANEHHHDAGFNATSMCPVAPQVILGGLPASVMVYRGAAFTWTVDPGSVLHGHSMITEIRYGNASVPDASASLTTYGKQIIKKEHQDLPVTFKGNMTFTSVGKVYIRAYAAVQGENFERRDVWGPELVLDVLPVSATGVEAVVEHSAGLATSSLTGPTGALKLGDAIRFSNKELVELTLTLAAAPAGAPACELSAGSMQSSTDVCVLVVPGAYEFKTDDVPQAKTVTVNVAQ